MSENTTSFNVVPDALSALQEIYANNLLEGDSDLVRGLNNLARLPEFDLKQGVPGPIPGQSDVTCGLIGFRRIGGQMSLAIACDTATVRYLPLDKYIALIEFMNDGRSANIVTQNHKIGDEGRGQVLMRLNPAHSAIHAAQGVVGRIIKEAKDIVLNEVYYFNRRDLTSFYLAAKVQVGTGDRLDSMISAYDGWKGYSIPIDPLNPVS